MMELSQIANLTNGKILGNPAVSIQHIATDSRSLPGIDHVLFVAIRGERHNGNDYISDAYERGIRIFLSDEDPTIKNFPDASFCLVENALDALQLIAAERRRLFKGKVIGITGSNGKTIVKEWLYQMLSQDNTVVRSPRSYNSQLGVPLSLWQLTNRYDFGIIEAGISLPGEMSKLERIIRPDVGILTNLGPAHSEHFSSDTHKLEEKLVLFKRCKNLIYCSDHIIDGKKIDSFLENITGRVSWSLEGEADYQYRALEKSNTAVRILLSLNGTETVFELAYTDDASVENILHSITALSVLGMNQDRIKDLVRTLESVEMRLETLKGIHGSTLVNDVYNSDLAGMGVALEVLDQQRQHPKKAVILSDVYQSGLEADTLYSEVAGLLNFKKLDKIYCIGQDIISARNLFPEGSKFFPDTLSFIESFDPFEIENSAVLIKGARKFHFEDITRILQLQVHKTVLEINVNELIHNLNYFRSLLKPETKIMVMVKALSYGAGAHEIAGYLQHEQVDYLAVAFPDEGIRLRKSGVRIPVMVMNADVQDYRKLLEHNLEPEIYSREGLLAMKHACRFLGLSDQAVHLKLDTGMHRLGFEPQDIDWIIEELKAEEIKVASIFSHLAGSDKKELDSFTEKQVDRFFTMANQLKKHTGDNCLLHILNSAGVIRFPKFQMNMVRIGIGLYGQGPTDELEPVSTFKTVISQVKQLSKDETIGYNRSGKLTKDSLIATIPVGYADGIDRHLGNGNYSFFVKGKYAPTVGNVCMDMTMIDITGIDATVGDQVELFGKNNPVAQMAMKLDTIVYEILTSIPERVKRVYIRE